MRRQRQRAHARDRTPRPSRALPVLLGFLMLALGALAGTAFLMPELLVDLVPPPLDVETVGMAAGALAAVSALGFAVAVIRRRRHSAEREFSRPQLTTVAALTPEEEAAARQNDEASPLLPEPPSLSSTGAMSPEPVGVASVPAPVEPFAPPAATQDGPRGSGVHIFAGNQPSGNGSGNGHTTEAPAPEPLPERTQPLAPQEPRQTGGPFDWTPRHTEDGSLLLAEAWSFGPAGGRRKRR